MAGQRPLRPRPTRRDDAVEVGAVNAEGVSCGFQPRRRSFGAEGEQGGQADRAARFELLRRVAQERLGEKKAGVRADGGDLAGAAGREEVHARDADLGEQAAELVLHDVGEASHHQQGRLCVGRRRGRFRRECGEAGVLALGEGGLDAAAGIVDHPKARRVATGEARGGAAEIELDHFGGAGAHQEQHLDVRAAGQKLVHDPVQLLVGVGHAGEVALLHDGGGEAGFGEHHHPCGRLYQVGARARADHQEKGVLDLSMQPDDAGQAAENLPLAALPQDGAGAVRSGLDGGYGVHWL